MARTATGMKGGRRKSAVRESKGWGNNVNESRSKGCGIKAGRTRETETRGGKDSRNIDRGGGEWDCSLCLVVTVRPYIHSSMRLIGQRKVMWVEGEGGAWRLTENNRRGSKKKKKGMCVRKTGDGLQQRQTRKTGRLLTSHCDTDRKRRVTLTAHPLQDSASAKWLLFNESGRRVSRFTSVSPCCGWRITTATTNSLLATFQN